jgi:hypothetical protein
MELIDIIYTVLMITCGLLIFVTVLCFFLSKMNKENSLRHNKFKTPGYSPVFKPVIYLPVTKKSKDYFSTPKIFNLENAKPREVNIILKPTMITSTNYKTNNELKKKNDKKNNQRYTIINDEFDKKNSRTASNYL